MILRHGSYTEIETAYVLGEDPEWQGDGDYNDDDLLAEMPAQEPPVYDYLRLQEAYDIFNWQLFERRLPPVVFTLRGTHCQVAFARTPAFITRDGRPFDEIGFNPTFTGRSDLEMLSNLVHEMCHIEEFINGTASHGGYHNKQWVALMERVGLVPYNLRDPEKQTGVHIHHRIKPGGPFEETAQELLDGGWTFRLSEPAAPDPQAKTTTRATQKRKTKYTCDCSKVWGKPGLNIMCCECGAEFEEQD